VACQRWCISSISVSFTSGNGAIRNWCLVNVFCDLLRSVTYCFCEQEKYKHAQRVEIHLRAPDTRWVKSSRRTHPER
jgi:hypothetical protein